MARRRRGEQPVRVPTGGNFGARQQLEAAQAAQPLPDVREGGPAPTPAPGGAPADPAAAMPPVDVFGPSTRGDGEGGMGEPPIENLLPDDPVSFLRSIAMAHPSPGIIRLLERAAGRRTQ